MLTLVGQPGCHLCDDMREVLLPVLRAHGLKLQERNVHEDPRWERLYLIEIPVLLHGEVEVARHRITAEALRRRLGELRLI